MAGNWVPGDWHVSRGYNGHQLTIEMPEARGTLAWLSVPIDPADEPEWEASARLIAAAPDLYEALENAMGLIIAWGATYQVDHGLSEMHPTHAVTVNEAQAALRKARGDQPDSDPPIPNSATPQGA